MPLLLILFIGVPITEITLFIQAGELIGIWWTLAIVIVTAFIGTGLVRQQGIAVLNRAQIALQENRMPLKEVFSGICLLIAGVLLLTPGFLTDITGFCLLIPPLRAFIGLGVWKYLKDHGTFQMQTRNSRQKDSYQQGTPDDIIEGEFEIIDPDDNTNPTEKIGN